MFYAVVLNGILDELPGLLEAGTSFQDVAAIYYTPDARFYKPGQPERIGPAGCIIKMSKNTVLFICFLQLYSISSTAIEEV